MQQRESRPAPGIFFLHWMAEQIVLLEDLNKSFQEWCRNDMTTCKVSGHAAISLCESIINIQRCHHWFKVCVSDLKRLNALAQTLLVWPESERAETIKVQWRVPIYKAKPRVAFLLSTSSKFCSLNNKHSCDLHEYLTGSTWCVNNRVSMSGGHFIAH